MNKAFVKESAADDDEPSCRRGQFLGIHKSHSISVLIAERVNGRRLDPVRQLCVMVIGRK